MKNMLLVLLLFTSIDLAYAQSIRGAEFVKQATVDQELVIQLKVYREGASKDAIDLDWGDGQTETLPLTYFELSTSGFRIDTYSAIHEYDTAGYYELTFRDSFLVADVLNIQDSHNKFINLKDSVLIFEANHPFSSNYMPEFWPRQFNIEVEENGTITHWAYFVPNDPGMPDAHLMRLAPFPAEGYTLAEATNAVYMDNALLVWDRPVSPGTYAFCIQVREMREDFFDEFPGDSILMSTTHRAMMIDVDSSMLVSAFTPWVKGVISVFPNPAMETISIQFSIFDSAPTISIYNLSGQIMFVHTLSNSSQLEVINVDVENWQRGFYVIKIETANGIVTRKVLLE